MNPHNMASVRLMEGFVANMGGVPQWWGGDVPANGEPYYLEGCIFVEMDPPDGRPFWMNIGDHNACQFVKVP